MIEDAARRTARSTRAGASAHRRHRLLQLLSRQEPGRLRRGRHGRHQRRRDCAQTIRMLRDWGAGDEVRPRAEGLQLPDGRHPGRGPAREAAGTSRPGPRRAAPHAARYDALLAGRGIAMPASRRRDARHVYHVYAIRWRDRDALQRRLQAPGIADRHPLPDAGAPPAGLSPISATAGRLPARRARRRRGAVAADVPGADADEQIERVGAALRRGGRRRMSLERHRHGRVVRAVHGRADRRSPTRASSVGAGCADCAERYGARRCVELYAPLTPAARATSTR